MIDKDKTVLVYDNTLGAASPALGCNARRVRCTSYRQSTGGVVSLGVAEVAYEPQAPEEVQRALAYKLPIVYAYYAWEKDGTGKHMAKMRPYVIRPEDKDAVAAVVMARHPGTEISLLTLPEIVSRLREGGAVVRGGDWA